ncbi:MAG: DMT family transporter [Bacteroidota bacterium]
MGDKKLVKVYLYAIFAMIFWSLTFVCYDLLFELNFKPITIVLIRLFLSSIVLFSVLLIINKYERIKREDYTSFLLLASFEPFFYFIGESYGIQMTSPAMASIIISTIPLFAPIFGFYVFKERITSKNILGIAISTVGLIILTVKSDFTLVAPLKGLAFLFLAVASTMFYGIYLKKLSVKYTPMTIVAFQNTIGIFYFLPLFFLFDFTSIKELVFTQNAIVSLFYLALFGSSLAFILYTIVIREIGMAKANVFTNIIPIFTAIFSYFIVNEQFTVKKVLGITVILIGLFLAQMKSKKN